MTKQPFQQYASVILDKAIERSLDYGIPDDLLSVAQPGARVEIPLRGRKTYGTIVAIKEKAEVVPVRPLSRITSQGEMVTPALFRLARWMAHYYCCSLYKVLRTMLPSSVRRETKERQMIMVRRNKSLQELRTLCAQLRGKRRAQAEILDVILSTPKGMLLNELLQKVDSSRSPVDSLVKRGALQLESVRVDRSPLRGAEYFKSPPKKLTEEQQRAFDVIANSLEAGAYETYLLHGVTGSGKTEVYLQAIDRALALGKGAIVLVPEIALTAQTIERFRSRFDQYVAILHHRLSHGERFDEWCKIHRGEARIVIGPRSALFSPVYNLGLIIVDEEHDGSYKQSDEAPTYHARDVAVVRAYQEGAVAVLGSATPALESRYNVKLGKFQLLSLTQRPQGAVIPKVTLVDMRREFDRNSGYTNFSSHLLNAIEKRISLGEQSILFLNRRGYHTTLSCQACGEAISCNRCSVSLTFHRGENTLSCHLCGYAIPPPNRCPSCKEGETMKFRGVGTEQIERALHAVLPEVRTIRIDADTTRRKGSHQKLFREFRAGKADVLIGTQMVAKGLHFPQVTLVGVLNADQALQIPDFRSSERTFQMITQVAGRAGRAELEGEVVIQTRLPENSTIQHASAQNYETFYVEEIESRKMFGYPPFSRVSKFRFSGEESNQVQRAGEQFRTMLARHLGAEFLVQPLLPSGYAKIKERYYFHFLVIGQHMQRLAEAFELTIQSVALPRNVRLLPDIDTQSTFF